MGLWLNLRDNVEKSKNNPRSPLGKFHPHGDSSVYDALARMAQPFVMRTMLVDGHGNFGSIDGDSPAAMRYTEARMTAAAEAMLRDIDKDTVGFHLNFDDTVKEPDLLQAYETGRGKLKVRAKVHIDIY